MARQSAVLPWRASSGCRYDQTTTLCINIRIISSLIVASNIGSFVEN